MDSSKILITQVPLTLAGLRLDQALTELFPDFSRSRLQTFIHDGLARVDGRVLPAKHRVLGGEHVTLHAQPEPTGDVEAQDIPLDLVYADDSIMVIDKPAGLVVHPAAGHPDGTLQNALLHHAPEVVGLPRYGIVHRLDKDTSGLLVAAKTAAAYKSLVEQLRARTVSREYLALVQGHVQGGATLEHPIGRHPSDRKRFAVRMGGKPAVTHFRVEVRFPHHTVLRVKLETGRTHQIRVHLAHIGHPLVGDPVYGGRRRLGPDVSAPLRELLCRFQRQALHAQRLGLVHPRTGDYLEWSSPLPQDLRTLLDALRAEA